jgi:hypothetical protein
MACHNKYKCHKFKTHKNLWCHKKSWITMKICDTLLPNGMACHHHMEDWITINPKGEKYFQLANKLDQFIKSMTWIMTLANTITSSCWHITLGEKPHFFNYVFNYFSTVIYSWKHHFQLQNVFCNSKMTFSTNFQNSRQCWINLATQSKTMYTCQFVG